MLALGGHLAQKTDKSAHFISYMFNESNESVRVLQNASTPVCDTFAPDIKGADDALSPSTTFSEHRENVRNQGNRSLGGNSMPTFKTIVAGLAISTAATGGAVSMGALTTSSAASATTASAATSAGFLAGCRKNCGWGWGGGWKSGWGGWRHRNHSHHKQRIKIHIHNNNQQSQQQAEKQSQKQDQDQDQGKFPFNFLNDEED
ncbi:hypothetical protein [Nonomuraea sp. SYSU D8015]|uniref:hypothetical protein n=1 Tax=Nonomuraea sp. SYSU D8015 TaxID=2593644 RepID=UPI001660AEF3|nr:hypothetical protein [Nonomuraea sp. SYSU D8015]